MSPGIRESGPTATLVLRSGRSEEIQGLTLLAASALFMSSTTGGEGELGRVASGVLEGLGVGVFYPALVLALWGTRRFQHQPAFRSRTELACWALQLPVLVTLLERVHHGSGGTIGFWGWAYLSILLGGSGSIIALLACGVVLLCYCLDLSPRHLFRRSMRIADSLVVRPVQGMVALVARGLQGLQGGVHVVLRDVWVAIDLLGGRVEAARSAAQEVEDELLDEDEEDDQQDDAGVVAVFAADPASAPPVPETRRPSIERTRQSAVAPRDEFLDDPRLARAMDLRRSAPRITPWPDPPRRAEPAPASQSKREGERPPAPTPSPEDTPRVDAPAEVEATAPPPAAARVEAAPPPDQGAPVARVVEVEARVEAPPAPAAAGRPAEPQDAEGPAPIERPAEEAAAQAPKIRAQPVQRVSEAWTAPPIELFIETPDDLERESDDELHRKAELITVTLRHFGIESKITRITCGPTITQFELVPAAGVKLSKLTGLSDDLAMALAVGGVRIEAPIPGRGAVGIEVPNSTAAPVYFHEMVSDEAYSESKGALSYVLGKDISGRHMIADLAKAPHMLVAGATGAGKSVCINTIISSLLLRCTPNELRLIMIDPKMVELMIYDGIPHLVSPVVTDPNNASAALKWAVLEMERRYRGLSKAGYRNIASFNKAMAAGKVQYKEEDEHDATLPREPLPYMVIVIDELADLMMVAAKDVEDSICRLAQMARAVGMHLIVATQRPSTNVITGIIKANLPTRIAFRVASKIDSKVILDHNGAESLLGRGDMLFQPVGQPKSTRVQGAFIQDEEIKRLVAHLREQAEPDYADIVAEAREALEPDPEDLAAASDEYLAPCIRMAVDKGEVSTSMLQRHFKIGYNRAANIIEVMEAKGIVSGAESGRRRKVLVPPSELGRVLGEV